MFQQSCVSEGSRSSTRRALRVNVSITGKNINTPCILKVMRRPLFLQLYVCVLFCVYSYVHDSSLDAGPGL